MQISILDPFFQTAIFITFLVAAILFTSKRDPHPYEMNRSNTNELKGIAILMVIFSHICFFLFSGESFLYPIAIMGGVGVNIFLFLSGFGLTISEIKNRKTFLNFYYKRLSNIFVPMWIVLGSFLILDFYLLNITYSATLITQNILGFFPVADIFDDINSPLWYFSLILFYYLIFPFVFRRKWAYISAAIILVLSLLILRYKLPVSVDVLKLYKLHYLAFPLGMVFAYLYQKFSFASLKEKMLKLVPNLKILAFIRYLVLLSFLFLVVYTAIHSGVGSKPIIEQLTSLVTVMSLVIIFFLKKFQSNLLITLGAYSYFIYLVHWPIMWRYDFIYKYTAPFLGTILYIGIFIIIGFILDKLVKMFTSDH